MTGNTTLECMECAFTRIPAQKMPYEVGKITLKGMRCENCGQTKSGWKVLKVE